MSVFTGIIDKFESFSPVQLNQCQKLLKGDYTSFIRNKQIAGIFKEANEIEQYGSGIRRIVDSCMVHDLPEPKFEEFVGGFRVTVFKTTQKTMVETRVETRDTMLRLIKGNPLITKEGTGKPS